MRAWVYHILSAGKYYLCVYVLINSVSYFFFLLFSFFRMAVLSGGDQLLTVHWSTIY